MTKANPQIDASAAPPRSAPAEARVSLKRVWPLIALALALIAVLALDLDGFLTFSALRDNRDTLRALVASNMLLSRRSPSSPSTRWRSRSRCLVG